MTRYGVSCWAESVPRARRPAWPRLRGDQECQVVVVGGGLAGCASAYAFAQAGVRTMLVEADRVAGGATSLATGLIGPGAGARFLDLRERHGLRAARHMWDAGRRAGLDTLALARRLRIRCDLVRLGVIDVAGTEAALVALEREHRVLTEAGFGAAWLTHARVRAATGLEAEAALKQADGGWANPVKLALGLATHAERRGAVIFERSDVQRIDVGSRAVELRVDGGRVRAAAVVVATALPGPGLEALHRHLAVADATVAVIPPLPAALRRAVGPTASVVRDWQRPPHAWRLAGDGSLMLWQAGQPAVPARQRDRATVQRTGQLMYEFSLRQPAVSGIVPAVAWTTGNHRSADGLVIAGPHRNFPRHLFVTGLGVDGLQGAWLAARLNLRHYLGAPEKGDELFGFGR
jgi:glycine/D-amino acid oxidase-like deaminating enzyme